MIDVSPTLERVLLSAARLQAVVPDAVLVGGSAAALHAGHRDSLDHDHVLADLADPRPRDTEVIDELPRYKGLKDRYHRWEDVVEVCRSLALRLGGAV